MLKIRKLSAKLKINQDIFYKKVELEGIFNIDTIWQEIEEDKLSKDNLEDDEANPTS